MTSNGTSGYFFNIGGNVFNVSGDWFLGEIDDVRLYNRALTQTEIPGIMLAAGPELAADPKPANKATDVPADAILAWKPGRYAVTHDVYYGTGFDDVNTASRTAPLGVLASQGQDANTYDPVGALAFGQTYYWRVDEVNAPATPGLHKGDTWSFTAETYGYPVKPLKATASSSSNARPADVRRRRIIDRRAWS